MRWLLALFLVVVFCSVAVAEDYTSLGDAIVKAAGHDDTAALVRLKDETDLDHWIVADEVMSRGLFEAAMAWALAAHDVDEAKALARYIARTQTKGYDQTLRKVVHDARKDRVAGKADEVRKRLLEGLEEAPQTVEGVRLLVQRSNARVAFDPPEKVHADRDKAIDAAIAMGWHSGAAETCRIGAIKANRRREPERTKALLRRRVEIQRTRRSAEELVDALLRLHRHLDEHGTSAEALPVLEHARVAARESGDVRLRAEVRVAMARQPYKKGDRKARALIDEAYALAGSQAEHGYVLNLIGLLHEEFGQYDEALRVLRKAAELAEGEDLRSTLFDLGWEYSRRGSHAEAERTFERLLQESRKARDPWFEQTALYNLTDISRSLDRMERANRLGLQAMALAEKLLDTGRVARSLRQLATLRSAAGQVELAFDLQSREIAIREQTGTQLSLGYALRNRGHLHKKRGDYASARSDYERSLALARDCESEALEADLSTALASMSIRTGKYGAARRHAEQAFAIYEKIDQPVMSVHSLWQLIDIDRRETRYADAVRHGREAIDRIAGFVEGLSDADMARVRQYYTGVFGIAVHAAWKIGDHDSVFYVIEKGCALGLLMMMGGREKLSRAALPPELERERAQARAGEAAAYRTYQRARETRVLRTIRERKQAWEAARERRRRVGERIEREMRLLADLIDPKVDDLATLQARLRPGEAFLNYVFSGPAFAIQIVEHGKPPRLVELKPKREALRPIIPRDWFARERDAKPIVDHLRRELIAPLGLAPSTKTLLISHEEELLEIPFGMLVPDLEVVYVPSATTYGLMLEQREARGAQVLAIGDPAHDAAALRLPRLPHARLEAAAVGDIVLSGKDATEPALLRALSRPERWRAVHLACHGRMNAKVPLDSDLVLAPSPDNDGLLTAGELTRVHFNADLVTLSACETGRGKTYQTEGLFGLTRSVLLAGAPRVVVSLWNVDDEATRALMERFYALWKAGAGTAAALRDAKAFVRSQERWQHPYYWAAWVLWGLPD